MFQSARIKLTLWYVLITMIVSMAFSTFIYINVTREFRRFDTFQKYLEEYPEDFPPPPKRLRMQIRMNADYEREARQRILMTLVGINLFILGAAGMGGYFLAGLSLQPIKKMIDDQNRFITDASHELRTPLTVLKSEIEVSLRDEKLSGKEAKEVLKSNLEEVDNLQILTDNLLELAAYQQPIINDFEKVDIREVVESAIGKAGKSAKQKKIQIRKDLTPYEVEGSPDSLVQLFVILLDNAVKYSPEEGVIEVKNKKSDRNVCISVIDQGIGIDKKDLPHIFKRFYRSDSARSKMKTSGYGLGLSIAKKIVENHNGTIRVDSKTGKGTTFTVLLPLT